MPNDVAPEAGSQAVVEKVVVIHDDKTDHDKHRSTTFLDFLKGGFEGFLNRLTTKDMDEIEIKQKEEHKAYKRLLHNLEDVHKEQSWDARVVKFTIHAALLAVFVVALVTLMSIDKVSGKQVLHLNIPRWVALFMVAVSGLPCIRVVTRVVSEPLVWYRIRRTRMYTMYVARKMKRSVDVTLWLLLVLGVWYTWFRPQIVKDTRGAKTLEIPIPQYKEALKVAVKQVTRLLMALTLGAFLWVLKNALYVRLNGNIHYKDLCPLIRRTILDYHAIQFIAPDEEEKRRFLLEDGSDLAKMKSFWLDVSYLKKGRTPIWILKTLCSLYRDHMLKKKPKILSDLTFTKDEEKFLEKAKDLYEEFSKGQDNHQLTFGESPETGPVPEGKEIDFVFKMFYSKYQQQITEVEFQRWAVRALKGCLRLERILESSRRLFKKLNLLMISCVVVLVIIIWLLISEIVTTTQLAILFAPLISASFVIGDGLKNTFNGLIFVFGMHPFDVDQRVIVDNVQMRVTRLSLLTTVFFVYETGDDVVYPNSVLATKSITKQDHIKYMSDCVEFTIPLDSREELISDLVIKIKKSLDDELAFTSDNEVAKKEISETNITLIVHFKYLVPYHSAEIKARHRSKIFEKIVRFREEMNRVYKKEKAIENKEDEYEVDTSMKFLIKGSMVNRPEIDELKKKITEILQGCKSSKDYSKVLFTGMDERKITMTGTGMDERKITMTMTVHIMFKKDLLKPGVKEDLKHKIQELKDQYKVQGFLEDEDRCSSSH